MTNPKVNPIACYMYICIGSSHSYTLVCWSHVCNSISMTHWQYYDTLALILACKMSPRMHRQCLPSLLFIVINVLSRLISSMWGQLALLVWSKLSSFYGSCPNKKAKLAIWWEMRTVACCMLHRSQQNLKHLMKDHVKCWKARSKMELWLVIPEPCHCYWAPHKA